MDLPDDPFPDLTLVTIPGALIVNSCRQIIQLYPERVVAAMVVDRNPDGVPLAVRIV